MHATLLLLALVSPAAVSAGPQPWDLSRLSAPVDDETAMVLFLAWANHYESSPVVKSATFAAFRERLEAVLTQNSRPDSTWKARLHELSGMTREEERAHRGLMAPQHCSATASGRGAVSGDLPDSFDWRDSIPLHVADQASCGSCWAFSATAAMESHHVIATGEDLQLAQQQLVDCAGDFNNFGCNGGLPSQAFEYFYYTGGQQLASEYVYTGKDGACSVDTSKLHAPLAGVFNLTVGDEAQLKEIVATKGPVSIAFQVFGDFGDYESGVYSDPECSSSADEVNHAVLVMGYGVDAGTPYWTVQNSWGLDWGDHGYFKIAANQNMCGLADCMSHPIHASADAVV